MFKIHPFTNLINIILVLLILIFCNSSIPIFIGGLIFIFMVRNHKGLSIYWFLTLILLLINISCGYLFILGRIMFFLGYLSTIVVEYNVVDFIRVYDTILSSSDYERTKGFLRIIYFKDYFIKNYNIICDTTSKIGYNHNISYYIFCLKKAYILTNKSLDKLIYTFKCRFYFNPGRSKYKIFISVVDIFMVLLHLVILLGILVLGV